MLKLINQRKNLLKECKLFMIEKRKEHETKGKFSNISEITPLTKYEAISVPQGSVRLVKKTEERESSNYDSLNTKGFTTSSPVPLKTHRVG
ncbi:hypothetical protein TNCV_3059951 [Trichonephila clavipes]|nr:hypothetical protein TNCV_3059951 [Trichonephila clavipes]